MLQVPAHSQIEGVTIFSDDALFYKFYLVAPAPSVRPDQNGRPIFLLVKYEISDEDRLKNPSAPAGGGYLNFDAQFEVPADAVERIRQKLQPMVDDMWRGFKNGSPADQARLGVAGATAPPKVEFGVPTWTGGKVSLDAPQSKELISARVAEATPSLLSGNIAVFNMDLTPAGATFMKRTLVDPDGADAIDLTPIQVTYDLKFWARLPAVRIQVKADSEKIYTYVRQFMDGRGIDACATYDFQQTVKENETLMMSGAIDVKIDTGSGSLPEEVIEELREYSLDLVKEMIQSKFFTDTPARPQTDSDQPSLRPGGGAKKYLKHSYNAAAMKLDFNLEQRSVVEWSIHPQTTLQTFFHGMSDDEIKQHVREIELDDDFFKKLNLTVRAFTDFESSGVSHVEVQAHYEGMDESNQRREKNETFTFTDSQPQTWGVSLIGSEREYQSRYRVAFKGREAGPFTKWERSKSPDLNVDIPNPGKVELNVLVGDVDFDKLVKQIQVKVAYEDAEAGVGREESVVLLSPTRQESYYSRMIYKPRLKPIQYKVRYQMKSGEVREDEDWFTTEGPQILINQDFKDVLKVTLSPVGDGWDDVVSVHVDLKYVDQTNHYVVNDTLTLKTREDFKTWNVPLRNRDIRDFQYSVRASLKSGKLLQSGWLSGSDTGTYPITVNRRGFRIRLIPNMIDFTVTPMIEVNLRYKAAGLNLSETFTFRDKTEQTWTIDAPDGAPLEYNYRITYYPAGGNPITMREATEEDDELIVPLCPRLVVEFHPASVDFTVTPIVTLDLSYDDDQNNVHEAGALTFTDKQKQLWSVFIKDRNAKTFKYTLTYFKADGTPQEKPAKASNASAIVIPRFSV